LIVPLAEARTKAAAMKRQVRAKVDPLAAREADIPALRAAERHGGWERLQLPRDKLGRSRHGRDAQRRIRSALISAMKRAKFFGWPTADFVEIDPLDIFVRDRWLCHVCGEECDPDAPFGSRLAPQMDHVVGVALGGSHTPANVACCCSRCNVIKGAWLTPEQARSIVRQRADRLRALGRDPDTDDAPQVEEDQMALDL
jgi:hypothetical protein